MYSYILFILAGHEILSRVIFFYKFSGIYECRKAWYVNNVLCDCVINTITLLMCKLQIHNLKLLLEGKYEVCIMHSRPVGPLMVWSTSLP